MHKVVYRYEYIDDWKKFSETSLSEKEDFYSHLNMEDVTDAYYTHKKRVCKDFDKKHLGEYHDFIFKAIHYSYQMYLRTFKVCVSKHMNLTLLVFLLHQGWHGKQS